MEEDIKVLEEFIYNDQGKKMSYVDVDYAEGERFINAIENLIKGYKEQQEYIKELESKDYQERLDD